MLDGATQVNNVNLGITNMPSQGIGISSSDNTPIKMVNNKIIKCLIFFVFYTNICKIIKINVIL